MTARRLALVVGIASSLLLAGGAAWAAVSKHKNQTLPYGEVNWDRGYVKISAVGLPPFDPAGGKPDPGMARSNAVSTAQKRLLGVVLELDLPKGGKVRDHLAGHDELKSRLRQLVYAATVDGKTYSDGAVEVTLTMPLKGANGLQGFLNGL